MGISDGLLFLICGFVLGVATLGFIHGYRYCGTCWLALIIGKRYENGCKNCLLVCCRQYPYLTDKVLEDD